MEQANQNFVFVENKKVPFNWRGKMVIGPTGELMMFTDTLCEMEEEFHDDEEVYAYEEGGIGPRSQI